MLRPLGFIPDVMHVHDWNTALIPNLLDRLYAADPELSGIATTFTLHNLAFQGSFGPNTLKLAELEGWGLIRVGIPHLDDVVNFMGRGIHFADVVNTVSERYALEIQTPELGEGLDELLRANAHKLYGIVNGIDTGADMLLMPSRFEPCGLAQLIALRYGTIPIVRETGGLADTIRDFDPTTDTGFGFVFEPYDAWQLYGAVVRAVETFKHRPTWAQLVRR